MPLMPLFYAVLCWTLHATRDAAADMLRYAALPLRVAIA